MTPEATIPAIQPWRLPSPDAFAPPGSYLDAIHKIFAYSEATRSPAELQLGRDRKLDRMRALLSLLGSPQAHFRTVLVAGTKGKGSMAAFLTSILEAAGYRVGRYTQPHLYSYRERTWACGRFITQAEIVDSVAEMADALAVIEAHRSELGHLTTFDAGTALSLLHFSKIGVEIAVVEVGVGGAHDATNALEPILALIGPVSLDHTELLGYEVADVAREKAGVLRRGITGVVAPQQPEATATIEEVAMALGAALHFVGRAPTDPASCAGPFDIEGRGGPVQNVTIPLRGRFQRENAAMAGIAAQYLNELGFCITEESIRHGLATVEWPGRFQTVVADPETIVDGAHNPYAGGALAATIRECLPGRAINLVIGMSREKDAQSFIAELAPLAHQLVFTQARHARSWEPAELAGVAESLGYRPVIACSPQEAITRSWASQPADGATIVTGSLFLVGDVLEWLVREAGAEDGAE